MKGLQPFPATRSMIPVLTSTFRMTAVELTAAKRRRLLGCQSGRIDNSGRVLGACVELRSVGQRIKAHDGVLAPNCQIDAASQILGHPEYICESRAGTRLHTLYRDGDLFSDTSSTQGQS